LDSVFSLLHEDKTNANIAYKTIVVLGDLMFSFMGLGFGLDDMGVMGNHNELTVICHF
jgi:hypothetical protein